MVGPRWKPRQVHKRLPHTATHHHVRKPSLATTIKPRTEEDRAAREVANSTSRLLQLPPELRNRIYEYVLPYRQDLRGSVCYNQQWIFSQCRIFHASRQLRQEALSLFAGSNLFEIRLHFGELHTLSMMNVLCQDPVAANALRNVEVVCSFTCAHAHTIMPFFGCVSVFFDRKAGTVTRTGAESWTNNMECDRNLKYGLVGEKCQRVREERVATLLQEVQAVGLHEKEGGFRKDELEELAARIVKKRRKGSGVVMPKVNFFGRALKREASVVGGALERYRKSSSFLG
ncbi:uncharacterized protein LTR77_007595 [Saxophila tyrrhenica]|uniref:Uncharacterized protein n=1 Tax=Saxophila tyrrhenica TaxID=1690608 RepID=A0AAV9P3A6_9PEZI|nr:hypothetical protein LTR77_007595 [Saxophila tyrrhenica]